MKKTKRKEKQRFTSELCMTMAPLSLVPSRATSRSLRPPLGALSFNHPILFSSLAGPALAGVMRRKHEDSSGQNTRMPAYYSLPYTCFAFILTFFLFLLFLIFKRAPLAARSIKFVECLEGETANAYRRPAN